MNSSNRYKGWAAEKKQKRLAELLYRIKIVRAHLAHWEEVARDDDVGVARAQTYKLTKVLKIIEDEYEELYNSPK